MTKTIAVINQKGGVGKTTTVANLGYTLAQKGKKVLLIDFDSQASLTNYFNSGLSNQDYYSIYELMLKELRDIPRVVDPYLADASFDQLFEDIIFKPTYESTATKIVDGKRKPVTENREFGVYLLPSKLELSDYELELSNDVSAKGFHLYNVIEEIKKWHEFDYIIIDCNPSLGALTMNAILAANDGVLIPTNLDIMSTRGVKNLIRKVVEVQEALKEHGILHYGVIGIVLNLYADWRTIDRSLKNDMKKFYPFRIFNSQIPESVQAKKAVVSGVTYSQMYKKAEVAYINLAEEIEERIKEMESEGPKILLLEEDYNADNIDMNNTEEVK